MEDSSQDGNLGDIYGHKHEPSDKVLSMLVEAVHILQVDHTWQYHKGSKSAHVSKLYKAYKG
jgi:hypothetical protein